MNIQTILSSYRILLEQADTYLYSDQAKELKNLLNNFLQSTISGKNSTNDYMELQNFLTQPLNKNRLSVLFPLQDWNEFYAYFTTNHNQNLHQDFQNQYGNKSLDEIVSLLENANSSTNINNNSTKRSTRPSENAALISGLPDTSGHWNSTQIPMPAFRIHFDFAKALDPEKDLPPILQPVKKIYLETCAEFRNGQLPERITNSAVNQFLNMDVNTILVRQDTEQFKMQLLVLMNRTLMLELMTMYNGYHYKRPVQLNEIRDRMQSILNELAQKAQSNLIKYGPTHPRYLNHQDMEILRVNLEKAIEVAHEMYPMYLTNQPYSAEQQKGIQQEEDAQKAKIAESRKAAQERLNKANEINVNLMVSYFKKESPAMHKLAFTILEKFKEEQKAPILECVINKLTDKDPGKKKAQDRLEQMQAENSNRSNLQM